MGPLVSAQQLDRVQVTSRSAATRARRSPSAAGATATSGFFTSRRSSATCATTCASPRRRSSDRSCASCRSTPKRRRPRSPTTPSTGWPPACGRTTSPEPTARAARCGPGRCGSTRTRGLPAVPYGGVKQSGHGRTLGAASLDELTQMKSVWMKVGGVMPRSIEADWLVVGGGSAGCVLAGRLSEDPAKRGRAAGGRAGLAVRARPPCSCAASTAGGRSTRRRARRSSGRASSRGAPARQEPRPHLRGRGLGGSSTVNGMMALRAMPDDYDRWAALRLPRVVVRRHAALPAADGERRRLRRPALPR